MATEVGIRLSAKDDTGSAFGSVARNLDSLKVSAASVGNSLAGLGIGLSAGAFVAFTQGVINSMDALNDLKDATGASIENISALEDIARRSGASFDTVSTALIKMNQGLNAAKPGSDTALAIEAIGLSIKDLKALDPAEALRRVAVGLSGFADDGNKARITQELFGKSLKDIAPLLNDVADAGALVGKVTTEQTKAAELLNKQFFALQTNALDASRTLVNTFIPTLGTIAAEFNRADTAGINFSSSIGGVIKTGIQAAAVVVSDFVFILKGIGTEIGGTIAQFNALGEGGGVFSEKGRAAWSAVGKAMQEDAARARAELDDFQRRILEVSPGAKGSAAASTEPKKPALGDLDAEKARLKALEESRTKAAKAAEEFKRELQAESQLRDTLSGYSANYATEVNRLAKAYAAGRMGLEQMSAAQLAVFQQQPIAKAMAKDQEDAAKAAAKAYAEEQKAYEDKIKALDNSAGSVAAQVQRLQDEETGAALAAAKNISLAVAIEEVGLARIRETYANEAANSADGQTLLALQREIESREKIITLLGNKDARTANAEAVKKAGEDWKKTAEQIESSITDALMRGWENGKSFAENFRDTVVNMFKTMVLRPVVSAIVSPLAGALTGAMGISTAANAAGTVGDTASAINGASMLSNLTGFFTDFKMASTNAIYEIGGKLTTMGAEKLGSIVTQNATAIGGFVNAAGYAMAAVSAIEAANQGKWGQAIGTGIGAWFGGPLGSAVGGAVGGWVDSAFGGGHEYTTGSGISGKFSKSGFSGSNYQDWRNNGSSGFFGIGGSGSSSGRNYSGMSQGATDQLSAGFASIQFAAASMAVSLGLNAQKVIDFTKDITVALSGDAEANKKVITDLMSSIADDVANTVAPSIASFAKDGETASATLARLSTSIISANSWLSMLRQRLFQVSLAGGDAASRLADAFGGLDQLAASSKAFYDTYYTNAEKVSASQEAMTNALKDYGIALPTSKAALRDLVDAMDLNTQSGREAYATLLKLAPQFAETAALMDQMATDAATALVKAFTANGELVPALDAAALAMTGIQDGVTTFVDGISQVHTVMLDTSSPVVSFNGYIESLSTGLTDAQVSALSLQDQVASLGTASSKAVIDFEGLTGVLANLDTTTFVAVVTTVFDKLAARISSTIDAITAERVAVREAALQIVNPTVMSKQSIQAGIGGINTALPSNGGLIAANAALGLANNAQTSALDRVTNANTSLVNSQDALNTSKNTMANDVAYYKDKVAELHNLANSNGYSATSAQISGGAVDMSNTAGRYNAATNRFADFGYVSWVNQGGLNGINATTAQRMPYYDIINGANPKIAADEAAIAAASAAISQATASVNAANAAATVTTAAQATAAQAAKKALLDYQSALQNFAIDSGKSVTRLSKLREETVKYYDAQKALSDLMGTSAATLRTSVANYRYSQLTPEAQTASLQAQFSSAYTMALSSQADGSTLASYADKLNNTLSPLIDKLNETGQSSLVTNYLAQAEAVAKLLEDNAPKNYQADSLAMLGDIDATLAALDASAQSAEKIIADAITAGSDRTAAGLHAVIAAITGQSVPAFATGAAFSRGGSVVKRPSLFNMGQMAEAGPEAIMPLANINGSLGVRVSGSSDAMVQELRALRQEVVNLRAESQATAIATGKTAKLLDGVVRGGDSINTVAAV